MAKNHTNTKTATTVSTVVYRNMNKPYMTTVNPENEDLTTEHVASLVAIIDTKTQLKSFAVSVGHLTSGLRKDGTPWVKPRTVLLSIDHLDELIAALSTERDRVKKIGARGNTAYKLSAADVAYLESLGHGVKQVEKAAPAAAINPAKNKAKETAPAVSDDVSTVAQWLFENASEIADSESFIEHIVDNEEGYKGKAVLRSSYNMLAEKYGKGKLQGQPAIRTIAEHIAAVFFKPKAAPAQQKPDISKPAVNKPASKPAASAPRVVNATSLIDDDALLASGDDVDLLSDIGADLPDF